MTTTTRTWTLKCMIMSTTMNTMTVMMVWRTSARAVTGDMTLAHSRANLIIITITITNNSRAPVRRWSTDHLVAISQKRLDQCHLQRGRSARVDQRTGAHMSMVRRLVAAEGYFLGRVVKVGLGARGRPRTGPSHRLNDETWYHAHLALFSAPVRLP